MPSGSGLPPALPTGPYVFDSSSLIDVERSRNLRKIPVEPGAVVIPQRVFSEVNKPGTPIATWLRRNRLAPTQFLPDEGSHYLRLKRDHTGLGDGEAAAIAIAVQRRGTVVTEDRLATTIAEAQGARCVNTEGYFREVLPQLI